MAIYRLGEHTPQIHPTAFIAENATIIGNYWWQWLFTSLFLAITTICINIVGDTLRDVMDPKSNIDK